ncbi:site-specific DNA-methyltransferase [Ascidiimonas sp. W6]|uniref:site-specific DNA-methyltransferase n=1 Tax=Ascidiimonas meishanensis TaxID=3128903 RepID=UPI0030EF3479
MTELSQREKDFLIEKLQKGEQLPNDFKYKLFPTTQKEYELVYAGKMRKEDILADEDGVTAAPLQIERTYNGDRESYPDGWKNMIVFGDNLQFLKTIYKNEDPLIKDKVKGKVKLIYIDPPFATESDFNAKQGQKAYTDKTKDSAFIEFIRRRLILAKEILAKDGVIFVHLDYKKAHYLKIVLDEVFGENNFINEIIWKRKGGSANPSNKLGVVNDSIFFYSNSNNLELKQLFTKDTPEAQKYIEERFNNIDENGRNYLKSPIVSPNYRENLCYDYKGYKHPPNGWSISEEIMVQWDNEGKLYFPEKGKRIYRKIYLDEYPGQPIQNLWTDIFVINPMATERVDYPTQKPESLLLRILELVTNEGDLVIDFFGGSGTTASVCEKTNRKWVVCDIGKLAFYTTQKRLLTIQESKSLLGSDEKYKLFSKSFATVNTGFYDIEKLFTLKHQEYQNFVLNLFEVSPKSKKIAGIEFQGERKDGYDVMIWKYWEHKDAAVDEDYLEILHKNIGKKVGDRIYIIAPANSVQFIDDYYEIGNVRYYFLKVPYQIIQELHKEKFKKFRQPTSSSNVNSLENAVGFHFIRQPEVKSSFDKGTITIEAFKAYYPDEDTLEDIPGLEALAMVVVDKDYNGKEFLMSDVFFAADIIDENGQAQVAIEDCGSKVSAVYIDIYGNEFREVFTNKNTKG